jgi:hypothetical protein
MTFEYLFVPDIRCKLISDDGRSFELAAIGPWLVEELTSRQQRRVFKTGYVTASQTRGLWQLLGRTDKPPGRCRVALDRDDFLRMFPECRKSGE